MNTEAQWYVTLKVNDLDEKLLANTMQTTNGQ